MITDPWIPIWPGQRGRHALAPVTYKDIRMKCKYLSLIFDDKVYLFQTNAVIWFMTMLPKRYLVALCSVLWPAWEGCEMANLRKIDARWACLAVERLKAERVATDPILKEVGLTRRQASNPDAMIPCNCPGCRWPGGFGLG